MDEQLDIRDKLGVRIKVGDLVMADGLQHLHTIDLFVPGGLRRGETHRVGLDGTLVFFSPSALIRVGVSDEHMIAIDTKVAPFDTMASEPLFHFGQRVRYLQSGTWFERTVIGMMYDDGAWAYYLNDYFWRDEHELDEVVADE